MKLVFLLLCLATSAHARWIPFETFRFQPADEGDRDPAFAAYRYKLTRAVETRDAAALLPLVSDDVKMSIRDARERGKARFVRDWSLQGPGARASQLWDQLHDVLRLGGTFDDGEFRAPYVFSRWPARFPHLDFFAVTVKRAPVYEKPDENSRELETLTQEIVGRFDELPNPAGWKAVRTASGKTGYLRAEDARSPLDYRAVFRREKSGWRLTLFAAGDWEAHERFE